jgi:hypothetical protein
VTIKKLSAEVSVEDKASKNLERITKNLQKQNNELLRLKTSMERLRSQSNKKIEPKVETNAAIRAIERMERAFKKLQFAASRTRELTGKAWGGLSNMMPSSLMLGAGALGGGYLGKQAFDSTFLQSANYEMSQKVIQAMFNDKKKSELYMSEMEKLAIGSPLLNSQDIFGNSKSFIALTKEQAQLEQMWDLSERLLAVDPKQGVEGAVFALRELFSGDSRSMAERFEMPKKALNEIKKLPIDQQLSKLDELFNKMGMTKKLVNEMGDTTLGVWNQIKETTSVALRQIGDPAVKIVKPFLDDANRALQSGKLSPYIKFGQDMAGGIAKGFVSVARGVGRWIDDIVNNPEFQKLDTIEQKFQFVLDKVYLTFDTWYENEGKVLLEKIGTGLVDSMITGIENNLPRIVEMGLNIGSSLVKGIMNSLDSWAVNNPVYAALLGLGGGFAAGGLPGAAILGGAAITTTGIEDVKRKKEKSWFYPRINMPSLDNLLNIPMPKKAVGMSRVPRDNYPALLHEGERILTKQEANSRGGSSAQVVIQIQEMNVRNDMDIKKIATALVKEIEMSRVNFGGA